MPLPRRAFTKWPRTPLDGTLSSIETKKPIVQNISTKMLYSNTVRNSRQYTFVTKAYVPKPPCKLP